jgi:NADH-quinone oxidoreductase subunit B
MSLNVLPDNAVPAVPDGRDMSDPSAGKGFIMHSVRGFVQEMTKGLFNWSSQKSIWPLTFGIKCCAIEMMAFGAARYDSDRMGVFFRASPRQADLLIIAGPATIKLKDVITRLYDQMPEPKYVIAFGECAICGGPFWDSYSVINGVDKIIPVDVYVPGCPPRPEQLLLAIQKLQERIDGKNKGKTVVVGTRDSQNPGAGIQGIPRMSERTREELLAEIMAHPTYHMGHQSDVPRVQPTPEELLMATPTGQPDEARPKPVKPPNASQPPPPVTSTPATPAAQPPTKVEQGTSNSGSPKPSPPAPKASLLDKETKAVEIRPETALVEVKHG